MTRRPTTQAWLQRNGPGYLFLLPHLVFFVLFVAVPLGYALVVSTQQMGLLTPPRFVGGDNFVRVWNDARFWAGVRNTVLFAVVSVPLITALGLGLALLLRSNFHGKLWPLVAFVSPAFFGSIGILTSWNWILASFPAGLANFYLNKLGVISGAHAWFATGTQAWVSILIVTAWWIVGFSVLLYLGALSKIPPEQYESAALDGAGQWGRFLHITIPWIRNVMFFDVARHVLLAFGLFDQVYILTGGGPGGATRTMVHFLYQVGFQRQQFGMAAAVSWLIFLIVIVFGIFQLGLLTRSTRSAEE